MNRLSASPILSFFFLSSALVVGCGSEDDQPDAYECYANADCGEGFECGGGSCIAVMSCGGDAECGTDSDCVAGVCRDHCVTDAGCGAAGLMCDTSQNLCMPNENPAPGTSPSSGGAASVGRGNDNSSGGSVGSGATTGEGGTPGGTGGNNPAPPAEPTFDLIDDLEDGDVYIAESNGRAGVWYTYNEATERPVAPAPVSIDGTMAMHAKGNHVGDGAYGGLGVEFGNTPSNGSTQINPGSGSTFDGSQYDGFEFRIKGGPGSNQSIRFEVVTPGVVCSGDGCYDSHGRDVTLSSSWTTVKIPYSSLVQEGWGTQVSFDSSKLLGVAFEDLTTGSWDFYVDDLKFYKDPPGGGSTGGGNLMCGSSWGEESNGSITWYTFDQGTDSFGDVNCSYGITTGSSGVGDTVNGIEDPTLFGAINTADYQQAATCGACVEVSRGSKKVKITVVDQCPIDSNPKCVKGHIDLSKAAFLQLGQESEGYIGQRAGNDSITWKYVPCESEGNVTFRLKENNPNWNMVIVENHRYPIASVQVEVNGQWLNASREPYNFWLPPGGVFGPLPAKVRATDIHGESIEGTVGSTSASPAAGQFACQAN